MNMVEKRRNKKEWIWWKDLCAACGAIEEGRWFNNAVRWKLRSDKKKVLGRWLGQRR